MRHASTSRVPARRRKRPSRETGLLSRSRGLISSGVFLCCLIFLRGEARVLPCVTERRNGRPVPRGERKRERLAAGWQCAAAGGYTPAVKLFLATICAVSAAFAGGAAAEESFVGRAAEPFTGDLDAMVQRRVIRALV